MRVSECAWVTNSFECGLSCMYEFCTHAHSQVHVQKRFEDLRGPTRQHLVSQLMHVEVTRGVSGPDVLLEGLITTTIDSAPATAAAAVTVVPDTHADSDVDGVASTAAAPTSVSLNAPPPPRVRRPMSSRTAPVGAGTEGALVAGTVYGATCPWMPG